MTYSVVLRRHRVFRSNEGRTWHRVSDTVETLGGVPYLRIETVHGVQHLIRQDEYLNSGQNILSAYRDQLDTETAISGRPKYEAALIRALKTNGGWMTSRQLAIICGTSPQSVSSKIFGMEHAPIEIRRDRHCPAQYRYCGGAE